MKFYLYKLKHNIEKTQFYAQIFCVGKDKSKPVDHEDKRIKPDEIIDPEFLALVQTYLRYKFIHEVEHHGFKCQFFLTTYTQIPYFIISQENGKKFQSLEMNPLKWAIKYGIEEANQAWLDAKEREAKLAARKQSASLKN